jgi:hypothetical protein
MILATVNCSCRFRRQGLLPRICQSDKLELKRPEAKLEPDGKVLGSVPPLCRYDSQ